MPHTIDGSYVIGIDEAGRGPIASVYSAVLAA